VAKHTKNMKLQNDARQNRKSGQKVTVSAARKVSRDISEPV